MAAKQKHTSSSATGAAAEKPAYTRRELFTSLPGSAVVGSALAAAGAAAVLTACSGGDSSSSDVDVLTVASDAVVTLDSFKEIKKPSKYYNISTLATLASGSQLFSSGKTVAAVLTPGETSDPLSTVQLINMSTGYKRTALSQPVGHDEGFNIYEVRASDDLLVWVESNYLTGAWRVYSTSISSGSLGVGDATLLDEGDIQYDAPEIAAVGSQAYWIYQPAADGEHTTEDSYLKMSSGAATPGVVITSHGRFNGGLTVSDGVLTCMPRADVSGSVYYVLTAVSGAGIIAQQTMPHSYRPANAIYVDGAFSFGIGAGYDYGDGIANVGTYYPISADGTWLRLIKQPLAALGSCKGWLFCKSGSRTVFVDVNKKRYFTIDAPDDCEDWGDYPACVGASNNVVVYTTTSKFTDDKKESETPVRKISLVSIA